MKPYPKIQTVFKRDPDNNYRTLLFGEYSEPEFEYLAANPWIWREKIHGTNIRVIFYPETGSYEIRGRKDKSLVPQFIKEAVWELIHPKDLADTFDNDVPVCLYGEGYGRKMQSVGDKYIPDGHGFILFDVRIGDWWLIERDVMDIAVKLGIESAPIMGVGPLDEALDFVEQGFTSIVAEKELIAEGLVLVPGVPLRNRAGKRIITKIKHKDFEVNQ